MENKSKRIEEIFKQDLSMYLAGRQRIDEQLPDAPDIEEQWAKIGEAYLPDAMREFTKYPTVALGWIMFVGMAARDAQEAARSRALLAAGVIDPVKVTRSALANAASIASLLLTTETLVVDKRESDDDK